MERNHASLVYTNSKEAYEDFIHDLAEIMKNYDIEGEQIEDSLIQNMIKECRKKYFKITSLPPVKDIDIESILKYYAYYGWEPEFISIDKLSRDKVNLSYIAQYTLDNGMGRWEEKKYLRELWDDDSTLLKIFYSEYEYFERLFEKEIEKIIDGPANILEPKRIWEQRKLKEMSLNEWIAYEPVSGHELKNEVYEAARVDGGFKCAYCKKIYPRYFKWEVDHIKPMSKGGLTVRENLQLLCQKCNRKKSDHEDYLPKDSIELNDDVLPKVFRDKNKMIFTLDNEKKELIFKGTDKQLSFCMGGHVYLYTLESGKLEWAKWAE